MAKEGWFSHQGSYTSRRGSDSKGIRVFTPSKTCSSHAKNHKGANFKGFSPSCLPLCSTLVVSKRVRPQGRLSCWKGHCGAGLAWRRTQPAVPHGPARVLMGCRDGCGDAKLLAGGAHSSKSSVWVAVLGAAAPLVRPRLSDWGEKELRECKGVCRRAVVPRDTHTMALVRHVPSKQSCCLAAEALCG